MNARVLYLELAACGVDMTAGTLDTATAAAAVGPVYGERLIERVYENRDGLKALLIGQGCRDLDAIRDEARGDD